MTIRNGEAIIKEFNLKGSNWRWFVSGVITELMKSFKYGFNPDTQKAIVIGTRYNLLDFVYYLMI